jgi:ATP-dependent Clp protease ATP-binding subunit ClpX
VCKQPSNLTGSAAAPGGVHVEVGSQNLWVCKQHVAAFGLGRKIGKAEREPAKSPATRTPREGQTVAGPDAWQVPSPRVVHEALCAKVVGQESAKRQISLAVHEHYTQASGGDAVAPAQTHHILLLGPSGCGKTLIASTVGHGLQMPFVTQDATVFTPSGYHGQDVDSMVVDLLVKAHGDQKRASRGVIFMDEVDKLACSGDANYGSFMRATQSGLLRLIEGKKVRPGRKSQMVGDGIQGKTVDTSQTLFMFGGAFAGLEGIVAQRTGNRGARLGLRSEGPGVVAPNAVKMHDMVAGAGLGVLLESLEEYGMMPELLGRIPTIVALAPLTVEQLMQFARNMDHSPLASCRALFQQVGYQVDFTDDFVTETAVRAHSMKTGARAIAMLVNQATSFAKFDLLGAPAPKGLRVIVDADTLDDPSTYRVVGDSDEGLEYELDRAA